MLLCLHLDTVWVNWLVFHIYKLQDKRSKIDVFCFSFDSAHCWWITMLRFSFRRFHQLHLKGFVRELSCVEMSWSLLCPKRITNVIFAIKLWMKLSKSWKILTLRSVTCFSIISAEFSIICSYYRFKWLLLLEISSPKFSLFDSLRSFRYYWRHVML